MARRSRSGRSAGSNNQAADPPPSSSSGSGSVGGGGDSSSNPPPPSGPGHGGSAADVASLSRTLGISVDAVRQMLAAQGAGILPAASSGTRGSSRRGGAPAPAPPAAAAGVTNAWSDFMQEEGADVSKTGGDTPSKKRSRGAAASANADADDGATTPGNGTEAGAGREDLPLAYDLPVEAPLRFKTDGDKKKSASAAEDEEEEEEEKYGGGGVLCQTGTLDASIVGRSKRTGDPRPAVDLEEPTVLCRGVFGGVHVSYVAASSSSCHSVALTADGVAYGWGRNEDGQLGLGHGKECPVVPTPTRLEGQWGSSDIVAAAVGKGHTILLDADGVGYAAGSNKLGQCGVNSSTDYCWNFRRVVVVDNSAAEAEAAAQAALAGVGGKKGKKRNRAPAASASGAGADDVELTRVSCGEAFSVLLSSTGLLYTAGSAEYGQLGNGDTGEYVVQAGKTAFANSTKFERRAVFVTRDESKDASTCHGVMDDKIPLWDGPNIRISSVSCGKNHAVAVEAAPAQSRVSSSDSSKTQPRRVFSWGCGNYGCLGHRAQADEYRPRLVATLSGPLFASNPPTEPSCGAQCSMILTKQGHVYYWGKHRPVGEATMRPTIVDALANNNHVVCSFGGGSQTVLCGTAMGNTVSWGNGPYGELGYGTDGPKSSSKPKFVSALDKCICSQIACGYGHTLFVVKDDDEEDRAASSKIKRVEAEDVTKSLGG